MATYRVLTPGGRVSRREFPTRAAARAFTSAHPGYKRVEYKLRRERGLAAGKTISEIRGHPVKLAKAGEYRTKEVFRNGNRLGSVNELFRFVAYSEAPCLSVAFLVGGAPRPKSASVESESVSKARYTPTSIEKDTQPMWVRGRQPGESQWIAKEDLEQVILEETNLIGVVSRLRPDISLTKDAHVYGWQVREGEC